VTQRFEPNLPLSGANLMIVEDGGRWKMVGLPMTRDRKFPEPGKHTKSGKPTLLLWNMLHK
jgi:hypothetical protein